MRPGPQSGRSAGPQPRRSPRTEGLSGRGASYPGGGRNPDRMVKTASETAAMGCHGGRDPAAQQPPQQDRSRRTPASRSRAEASGAKKVATSVAHSGARGSQVWLESVIAECDRRRLSCRHAAHYVFFIGVPRNLPVDGVADIPHRRRNHVRAARPLAQIDQTAALAAKGEFRISAVHRLLADGTPQVRSALASHKITR